MLMLATVVLSSLWGLVLRCRGILIRVLSPKYIGYYQPLLILLLWLVTLMALFSVAVLCYRSGLFVDWRATFAWKRLFFLVLLALLLLNFNYLVERLLTASQITNTNQEMMMQAYHLLPRGVFLINGTLGAALFEETIYRACIFKILKNKKLAFMVSITVFPLIHTQNLSALAYVPTALVLTGLYYKRESLTDCILVHALHNAISFMI